MRSLACLIVLTATTAASAVVRMEIASESGPNATAQSAWLQLLAELDVTGVRVRGLGPGDKPSVEDLGTPERPLPRVLGILTRQGVLELPGGRFTIRQREALAAYLERLEGDGAAAVTAKRGRFGLTRDEFQKVFVALGAPIGAINRQESLEALLLRTAAQSGMPLWIDPRAKPALRARPTTDKVATLARGAALAVLLRAEDLSLAPEKPVGQPVRLTVAPSYGENKEAWPIGYKPETSPSQTAPVLMQRLPVEIEGFTLAQALDAIEARLGGVPLVYDEFALRRDAIDPTTTPVKLARTETFYKRIIDRLAFQAGLKTELRIDEAGTPFVWLTR
ncbi:hypothetical protein Pla111_14920 [Botrimarina hoheduenensis]|uniref:Uncharacterized protein n=2 Tax=Botrimarina hoheduenensis TaxID=2528000 RepID=A0A5C5W684_9BACT|nr:hypothetical protein Pla111_14920 [Botrimarina hoheduenensis]